VDNGAISQATLSASRTPYALLPHSMSDDKSKAKDRFVVLIVVLVILIAAAIAVLFVFSTNFS
jgi:hypothetical protein